jgi:hypothetical protein
MRSRDRRWRWPRDRFLFRWQCSHWWATLIPCNSNNNVPVTVLTLVMVTDPLQQQQQCSGDSAHIGDGHWSPATATTMFRWQCSHWWGKLIPCNSNNNVPVAVLTNVTACVIFSDRFIYEAITVPLLQELKLRKAVQYLFSPFWYLQY